MKLPPERSTDVTTLTALGLAPNTRLMTEPRLFQDRELLSALVVELEDELGFALAARTLFVVGLIHGLRDGSRAVDQAGARSVRWRRDEARRRRAVAARRWW